MMIFEKMVTGLAVVSIFGANTVLAHSPCLDLYLKHQNRGAESRYRIQVKKDYYAVHKVVAERGTFLFRSIQSIRKTSDGKPEFTKSLEDLVNGQGMRAPAIRSHPELTNDTIQNTKNYAREDYDLSTVKGLSAAMEDHASYNEGGFRANSPFISASNFEFAKEFGGKEGQLLVAIAPESQNVIRNFNGETYEGEFLIFGEINREIIAVFEPVIGKPGYWRHALIRDPKNQNVWRPLGAGEKAIMESGESTRWRLATSGETGRKEVTEKELKDWYAGSREYNVVQGN